MSENKKILVLNGPNLNILDQRESGIYGGVSLAHIKQELIGLAGELGVTIDFRQSNHEGDLVEWIQQAPEGGFKALVINPAAYTHTSIAIRDAISAIGIPAVEVHISNVYKREPFRHHSCISGVVLGKIAGFGVNSYLLGLRAAVSALDETLACDFRD